jgi:glycerol-3-phosphate acyltransferase PlsY
MSNLPLIAGTSYLLGSIPFGYLLLRIFHGEDVRQSGSGNIGATNVARRSPGLGAATLVLDSLKGSSAVLLAILLSGGNRTAVPSLMLSAAALFAVLGHVFPVWLRFRGGKGVATGLGAFAVIAPKAALIAAGVFVAVLLISRYVSLASMLATATLPLAVWILRSAGEDGFALALIVLAALLVVLKHHENIRRLLAGTENRFGSKDRVGASGL